MGVDWADLAWEEYLEAEQRAEFEDLLALLDEELPQNPELRLRLFRRLADWARHAEFHGYTAERLAVFLASPRGESPDAAAEVVEVLVSNGLPVFPCHPDDKRPLARLAPNGMDSATTDWAIVERWLHQAPGANWAVRCGPIETGPWAGRHLAVLDIDDPAIAQAVLERTRVAEMTTTARTPRGGLHVWVLSDRRCPTGPVVSGDGTVIGDVKANAADGGPGGYVMVVGHVTDPDKGVDGDYELSWWDGPVVVQDAASWFQSLLAVVGVHGAQIGTRRQDGDSAGGAPGTGAAIPQGRRNATLAAIAGSLRARGLDGPAIYAAIAAVNRERCEPPLPDDEVRRIAFGMERYPPHPNRGGTDAVRQPAEALERMVAEAPSDLNHGTILAERLRERAAWVPSWGWLVYQDGVWQRDPDGAAVKRLAAEALSRHYLELAMAADDMERRRELSRLAASVTSRARVDAALEFAKAPLRADPSDFDSKRGLLNVRNGVVDLATGQLLPRSPEYRFTRQAPVDYCPDAEAPRWQEFLRQVFLGNEAVIGFVQRLLGMALVGGNPERVFAVFWGSGRNGKSALITALRRVLGDYAATTPVATFQRFGDGDPERATPELATLVARRVVVAHEPHQQVKLSAAFIKNITGGDAVKARLLFHQPFEFTPDFLPVLVTNHKPELPGTDTALWDRVVLVPFLWRVPDDQVVPGLGEKLAAEEAAGILEWLVDGATAYLREGLKPPPEVQAATAEFRAEADELYRFLLEETVADPGATTPYKLIKQRYLAWCERESVQPASDYRLSAALVVMGYKRVTGKDGKRYSGVRLRDDPDHPDGTPDLPPPGDEGDGLDGLSAKVSGRAAHGHNNVAKSVTSVTSVTASKLAEAFEAEGAGHLLADEDDAAPPAADGPPHPLATCLQCRPAPAPWWQWGYQVCRRGPTLVRNVGSAEKHLLRHLPGAAESGPFLAVSEALLEEARPRYLVARITGYGTGWLDLTKDPGRPVHHQEPQRAWPLSAFAWEARQPKLPQTGPPA